jgi:hypothetical protein
MPSTDFPNESFVKRHWKTMRESLVPIWVPSEKKRGKGKGKVLYMDREGVFGNGNAMVFDALFFRQK